MAQLNGKSILICGVGGQGTVLSVQRSGARSRLRARLQSAGTEVEVELPPDAPAYVAGQVVALAARRHGVFAAAATG